MFYAYSFIHKFQLSVVLFVFALPIYVAMKLYHKPANSIKLFDFYASV